MSAAPCVSFARLASLQKYNLAHQKTRSIIEKAFGILRSRWRILDHTGGRLCYAHQKVSKIAMTCCVLHNICRRNGLAFSHNFDPVNEQFSVNEEVNRHIQQPTRWEIAQRQRLVSLIGLSTNHNIADLYRKRFISATNIFFEKLDLARLHFFSHFRW